MRKLLTSLLCVVMVVCMMPTMAWADAEDSTDDTVTNVAQVGNELYTSLDDAIENVGDRGTVKLLSDITLDEALSISKSLVLDLGGHKIEYRGNQTINCKTSGIEVTIQNGTISTEGYYAVVATAGTVNLTKCTISAAAGYAVYNAGADLTMNGCTVNTPNIGLFIKNSAVSLTGTTVTASSDNSYGIYVGTDDDNTAGLKMDAGSTVEANGVGIAAIGSNITIDVAGTITGNNYYGIVTNGKSSNDTINVRDGAVITSANGWGIYAPAMDSTTNIYGGTIIGDGSGIELRAGNLNIFGGTIASTAETFAEQANGSGTTVIGAAVAVSQHTTNDDITVTITGGSLSGIYAVYEKDQQDTAPDDVTLIISDGNFTGSTASVSSENCVKFITGGIYSDPVKKEYIAEDMTSVAVKSSGETLYYIGEEESLADTLDEILVSGDEVTVLQGSLEMTGVVNNVTVTNSEGNTGVVTVNGTRVKAGGEPVVTYTYIYIPTVTVQKPTIEADANATVTLDSTGTTATITVADGYELADVTVNGVSKGAVTTLTGLKTGDKVVVTTKKTEEPPVVDDSARIKAGVQATTLKIYSKSLNTKGSGKGWIQVRWVKSKGFKVDGYELYRGKTKSTMKKYDTTTKTTYTNKNYLKKGSRYYYKVRGYRMINGEKVYTQWSKTIYRLAK